MQAVAENLRGASKIALLTIYIEVRYAHKIKYRLDVTQNKTICQVDNAMEACLIILYSLLFV